MAVSAGRQGGTGVGTNPGTNHLGINPSSIAGQPRFGHLHTLLLRSSKQGAADITTATTRSRSGCGRASERGGRTAKYAKYAKGGTKGATDNGPQTKY